MDDIDWIQQREALDEQQRLRNVRIAVGVSAYQCRVCYEVIPEKRRLTYPGVNTCIACQTNIENSC